MTIADENTIDMIARSSDGGLKLIIVDDGLLDDTARYEAFQKKLQNYFRYIVGQLKDDHPECDRNDVTIAVACAVPPTEAMQKITGLEHPGAPGLSVSVVYEVIPSRYG
ncbi:hypothetical protein RMSM_04721 [Rhodopirellula maiorica SM1]|uniref:Uncharacterized protein n=1 Tax=Rhodopirellula maiorica SM1 TaxID=1265738 RepID=M5RWP2_9BACT|nr:DUF6572 domain-containing protein [Rhodopirellula maiorica]EMI18359.1 hypothetical protein RMSM_04721 [Rhodopirellula maiorica SM1]